MKLCLGCGRLSPAEAAYCGGCSKTLGHRSCENDHRLRLDPSLACCTTCGSFVLTDGVRAISLRPLGTLISAGLLLLCWRWFIAHACLVLRGIWNLFGYGVGVILLGEDAGLMNRLISCAFNWLMAGWALGWLLYLVFPQGKGGRTGEFLRGLPFSVVKRAVPFGIDLLRLTIRGVLRLFFGSHHKEDKEVG